MSLDNRIRDNWNGIKSLMKNKWSKITTEELDKSEGDVDNLGTLLQEKYGMSADDGKKRVNEIVDKVCPNESMERGEEERSGTWEDEIKKASNY